MNSLKKDPEAFTHRRGGSGLCIYLSAYLLHVVVHSIPKGPYRKLRLVVKATGVCQDLAVLFSPNLVPHVSHSRLLCSPATHCLAYLSFSI